MAADKLLNLEDLTKEELEPKATFARLAVPKAVQPEKTAAAIEEDNWRGKGKIGSG